MKWILAWFVRRRKAARRDFSDSSAKEPFSLSCSPAPEHDFNVSSAAALQTLDTDTTQANPVYLLSVKQPLSSAVLDSGCKNGAFCISCPLHVEEKSQEEYSDVPYSRSRRSVVGPSRPLHSGLGTYIPVTESTLVATVDIASMPPISTSFSQSPSLGYIPRAFPMHSIYAPMQPNQLPGSSSFGSTETIDIHPLRLDYALGDTPDVDLLRRISFVHPNHRLNDNAATSGSWLPDLSANADLASTFIHSQPASSLAPVCR